MTPHHQLQHQPRCHKALLCFASFFVCVAVATDVTTQDVSEFPSETASACALNHAPAPPRPAPRKRATTKSPLRLSRLRPPPTHLHPLALHALVYTCRLEASRLEEASPGKCGNGAHHTPHMNVSAEACVRACAHASGCIDVGVLARVYACTCVYASLSSSRVCVCVCMRVCRRAHVCARGNLVKEILSKCSVRWSSLRHVPC